MSARNQFHRCVVAIVAACVANPGVPTWAEPAAARPRVPDVQLDERHCLHGLVVNGEGRVAPRTRITLVPNSAAAGPKAGQVEARTDDHGRFSVPKLAAGVYRLETASGNYLCRVWTHSAAPPSAAASLLIVDDPRIERGQRPVQDIFRSDPLLMAAIVAAAIAIPIAVHKSQNDSPEGS